MQRCSHCSAQQLEGTIFCSECGASLIAASSRGETTASLNLGAFSSEPTVVPVSRPAANAAPSVSLVVIIAACLLAAWLPAARAARVDPMRTLRQE